jgi:hypothetical protein
VNVHRTGALKAPRAVKAITVVQEERGSGPDTRSATAGGPARGSPARGVPAGGVPSGTLPPAGAGGAGDAVGEATGEGGGAVGLLAVGAAMAGALADPSPVDCTDAGSAAAQGTRPHSLGGPGELPGRARIKPPPATTATMAVMTAAVTQGCRARLPASRGGAAGGRPGPLATAAHRRVPGRRMTDGPTRDMPVSPILVRPPANPGRRGQFSNAARASGGKHTGVRGRYRISGAHRAAVTAGIGGAPAAPIPAVVRWPIRPAQDSRAGLAAFGAISLKWTPVGSAASASRPYGVSSAGLMTEPPRLVIVARLASVSSVPK